jgi:outer membrane lipoprotein-sorting protein
MKKFFLPILASFLFVLSGFAQKDAKAKEVLDKSSAAFSVAGEMSADFTMNIKDIANKVTEVFDGVVDIKGVQYHIDMPDNEIWFNGKTQWVLQKAWEEVNVSEPSEQEIQMFNMGSLFAVYKKGCNYKYVGEKTDVKMRKVHEVELIPQKKGDITRIVMQIASSDFMPATIHLYFNNKAENIIYINKYKTKLNLSDSIFVFKKEKYPDVEIIDLR